MIKMTQRLAAPPQRLTRKDVVNRDATDELGALGPLLEEYAQVEAPEMADHER